MIINKPYLSLIMIKTGNCVVSGCRRTPTRICPDSGKEYCTQHLLQTPREKRLFRENEKLKAERRAEAEKPKRTDGYKNARAKRKDFIARKKASRAKKRRDKRKPRNGGKWKKKGGSDEGK